jgi:uncharacterized protein (DUF1501 family)
MSAVTRREIMRRAGMLAAAGAAPFAMNLLPFSAANAASTSGYRALVCVFLFGGMDGHDTFLPYDQGQYDAHAAIRQALFQQYAAQAGGSSRTRDRLLALSPDNAASFGGRQFALPEALAPIRDLFAAGKAAVVANVGPLIQPINRTQFNARSVRAPSRLFSHNDQQSTWVASAPEGARYGWGGRLGDMALASNANSRSAFTAISASGSTVFLTGQQTLQFQVSSGGPVQISALTGQSLYRSPSGPAALGEIVQDSTNAKTSLLERDVTSVFRTSIGNNRDLVAALQSLPPLTTQFPANNGLAQQLNIVARMIAVRNAVGVRRQVFFVSMGGFDTHSNQAPALAGLHQRIAGAMKAFYDATVELGVANDVTAFTASDFGRTLAVNGDGTDHGWGAHHFVVGGSLRGNRIIGDPPLAALNHAQDVGGGRLIPTLSVEQYAANLARWFGLTSSEVASALPGIANFDANAVDLFQSGAIT